MNIRMKVVGSCALAAVAVLLGGCGRDKETRPPEVAFAIIDGEPLTVSSVSNTVMVSARIMELSRRPVRPEMFARWGNGLAMKIIPQLIQATLFDRELQRMGVSPTAQSDAAVLAKYKRMTRQKAASFDELGALFGDLEPHWRRQFARESRFMAYSDSKAADTVAEPDVAARLKSATNEIRKLRFIDRMAATNARSAWNRLKAGEPWEVVATNCTEDALMDEHFAGYWKSWDDFSLDQVEPEELRNALAPLKTGEFTKPIEIDDGMAIVRVNEREGQVVSCSRILFRMAVKKTMPTRAEVVRELQKERTEKLQREILEIARGKAKIEYPLGERFTYAIWPEKRASRAVKNGILPKK